MKVTVLGIGSIGAAVAEELLAHDNAITQVQACDRHGRSLQALQERVPSGPLRTFQLDARDPAALEPILEGSACVVSCLPPSLNPDVARLCLSLGSHFCDLGSSEEIIEEELALAEDARKKSLWVVPACGLAPGLSNVLCLHGVGQFDRPEAAHVRVGDVPLHPEPPFRFHISWSAEKILDDYTNPVQLIEDGHLRETEPLSRDERIAFAPPFDDMEAFCTQGGLSTLAQALEGRLQTLDHKTVRWPGHAQQMRFLLGLGFGEDRSIDVRTHLTYRDVLVRQMRKRLGGKHEDAVLMRVMVQGEKEGRPQTLTYEMIEHQREGEARTAMERCTAVPAAAVAALLTEGAVTGGGAAPPEDVVLHEPYLQLLAERGLTIEERWQDGLTDVTARPKEAAAA